MTDANLPKLQAFLHDHSTIQSVVPSAPEYRDIRATYVSVPDVIPSIIVRPRTVEDAVAVVSFLIDNHIEFTVRGGGHDMLGRAFKHQTVGVDVRLINYVDVEHDSRTARVGGGILIGDLIRKLHERGLATAVGTVSAVGYVGWALYGGYGPYSARFGLGVDQILKAKVINSQGRLEEADADLLKGIRGAGGAFGVVVEVTVPVHKVDRILAGVVFFESEDLPAVIRQFNDGYRALSGGMPAALSVNQAVVNTPQGRSFLILLVWGSSDLEAGREWVDAISRLAPVVSTTVKETTPPDWLAEADRLVPKTTQGRAYTINVKGLTEEVVQVMASHLSRMPSEPQTMWNVHELRACSPSAQPKSDSVFTSREGHFMFEILPLAERREDLGSVLAWGRAFHEALLMTDPGNILPATYLSLSAPDEVDMSRVFGEHYEFLRELKGRRDPEGVFRNALAWF
ncbi:D-lactate dehydrogenase [Aspergillus coremiiformis]|uniref:D-lactate dehydrogenase n=1 Tax=Aspergillus coremiiformis TaxID=138285 RepID=A0A5N6YYM4_9EURO|nr:D-lactate dehydrogenase [Aspergillus coremiiformis]